MKALGVEQFMQKKYKMLDIQDQELKGILGNCPKAFVAVIYGDSGNGKTEFCLHLANEFIHHGKVAWISYEQGHGVDLQMALERNNPKSLSGKFVPIDPLANIPEGVTLLEDLDNYLGKRSSADFIFIDSIDDSGFNYKDYQYLKRKHGKRKALLFIARSTPTGKFLKTVGRDIKFDGQAGFFVDKYIANPEKNRLGGKQDYIVYEEGAKEKNPAYFSKRKSASKPSAKKEKKSGGIRGFLLGKK